MYNIIIISLQYIKPITIKQSASSQKNTSIHPSISSSIHPSIHHHQQQRRHRHNHQSQKNSISPPSFNESSPAIIIGSRSTIIAVTNQLIDRSAAATSSSSVIVTVLLRHAVHPQAPAGLLTTCHKERRPFERSHRRARVLRARPLSILSARRCRRKPAAPPPGLRTYSGGGACAAGATRDAAGSPKRAGPAG